MFQAPDAVDAVDAVDVVNMTRALFTSESYPFPKLTSGTCLRRTLVDIPGNNISAATKPYVMIVLDQGLSPEFDIKACERLAVSEDWEMCCLQRTSGRGYSGVVEETGHHCAWSKVPPRFQ